MIIVGSVRPGRVGLPIAEWARQQAEATGRFEIDFADLAEIALPLMDEPNHPRLHRYTKPYTMAWSERVQAADAFLLVTPEYNYSFSAALKNAIDYLNTEWWMKPVGFVTYGGASSGTRGMNSLLPTLVGLGLVRVGANVELTFGPLQVKDGRFEPNEKETAILDKEFAELTSLAAGLRPIRERG